jgi:hypothetical protein
MSLTKLATLLTQRGVPTPFGHARWSSPTVRGILRNPTYTGHVYAQRTRGRAPQVRRSATHALGRPTPTAVLQPADTWVYVGPVTALVSQAHFDEVQQNLAQNQGFARRHNTAHRYLLRALVSCGRCSLACTGRTRDAHYRYYVCSGKQQPVHAHRGTRCSARLIPATQLDAVVWADLCALLLEPSHVTAALERAHGGAWLPQDLAARREHLRHGQTHLAQQLERLTDAYLRAVIPLDEYARRRRLLEQQHDALAAQAAQLAGDAERRRALAGVAQSLEAFCARIAQGLAGATFEQRRELVLLLIDRVLVTDGEVEIRYVLPTSPQSEHVRFCHLRKDYFGVPPLMVQRAREAAPHLAPVRRRRPAPAGVARVEVDDGLPHPECLAAEAVVVLRVVASVGEHGIEPQHRGGLADRRRELGRVLRRPAAGDRADDQVRADMNDRRELRPRAAPEARARRPRPAHAVVQAHVARLEPGGVHRGDGRRVDQPRAARPREDGSLSAGEGPPFPPRRGGDARRSTAWSSAAPCGGRAPAAARPTR